MREYKDDDVHNHLREGATAAPVLPSADRSIAVMWHSPDLVPGYPALQGCLK